MKNKLLLCALALAGVQAMSELSAQNSCQAGFTFTVNQKVVTFTNTSTGAPASTYYMWDFGDGAQNNSNTQNPIHTYMNNGSYLVCLSIFDTLGSACQSNVCHTVVISVTGISSSSQIDISLSVTNPVFYSADIHYSIPSGGSVELVLFDIIGNKIGSLESGNKSAGMHSYTLNTVAFSKGIYFMHLNFEGATITKKIIIVR